MGTVNPHYNDHVKYELHNDNQGTLIIQEPVGWEDDEREYTRNTPYHGIIIKISNSLKFIGDAADYIRLIYDIDGINAVIRIKKSERHPLTNYWVQTYSSFLDLSTLEMEGKTVSCKLNSGGIEILLKARETEDLEIDRLTTFGGKPISALIPNRVEFPGRRIFLKSKWENDSPYSQGRLEIYSDAGNERRKTIPWPLKVVNKSHEIAQSTIPGTTNEAEGGDVGSVFFNITDIAREFKLKIDLKYGYQVTRRNYIFTSDFQVRLVKYGNGLSYDLFEEYVLVQDIDPQTWNGVYQGEIHYNNDSFTLQPGESLALEFRIYANFYDDEFERARFEVNTFAEECTITIEEDSFFEKSSSNFVLAHEMMDRLATICTDKEGVFYSDFLRRNNENPLLDGKGAMTGFTHGFWVRKFDKYPIPEEGPPKVENLYKPLTTSFRDAFETLNTIWNVGLGIERIGNKERIRLEELKYFYNQNTTIKIGQVKNVKRSVAADYYFSSVDIGYEKGGKYEEAMGLDEYNTKSTFTTPITRLKNIYNMIAKYRTDSYGLEFARRKPETQNNTLDTTYDNDIFALDVKRGPSGTFLMKTGKVESAQEGFENGIEQEPTGVFSPKTAQNLRFSPVNCLLRHAWYFGCGFKNYISDYIRYSSSGGNSQLKTKLTGQEEFAENGNIIASDLERPRFFPEWIEFEYKCDFEVMSQIEGHSTILGKDVPNFYGLVEFTNENNEKEKGFLFNLKPGGKGQWKLLKHSR